MDTSEGDFQTMLTLYKSKSYEWSLFLGHISTEKLLKALYVKRFERHAPFTHNLYRLAELLDLKLTDEYKREFYSLCTPDYTKKWIEQIKTIRSWIKEML